MIRQNSSLPIEQIWRQFDAAEQRLSAPLSERMLDLANIQPGMRVLDLATGRGEPAIRAAHRVGPTGSVLGVDVEEPLLRMAQDRADQESLANVKFQTMNVESQAGMPKGFFHVALSHWALMYLNNPVQALSATREAMSPEGVLVTATWAEPEQVSYYSLPRAALKKFVPLPSINQDVPGEFYYANADRLSRDFDKAGFRIIHMEYFDVKVMEARTPDVLVDWAHIFAVSRLLPNVSKEIQRKWEVELVRMAEPLTKDGYIRLGGVTRIVVAKIR